MGKIIVHTKFNKTGKRILTTPLQEKYVCAPANRQYRQAYNRIEKEFKKKMHDPDNKYIETLSRFIANYVASKSSSYEEIYKIVKFLANCGIKTTGPRIGA